MISLIEAPSKCTCRFHSSPSFSCFHRHAGKRQIYSERGLGTTKASYKSERLKRRRDDGNDRQISDYPSMSLIGASKPMSL